jgi:hypothetical protein
MFNPGAKHQATAGNHHLTVDDRGSRPQELMFTLALIASPLAGVIRLIISATKSFQGRAPQKTSGASAVFNPSSPIK